MILNVEPILNVEKNTVTNIEINRTAKKRMKRLVKRVSFLYKNM